LNQPQTRRENQRYEVDFEAEVTRGGTTVRGRVRNASLGGLYLEVQPLPRLGDKVAIRFSVGGHVVEGMAVVRWNGHGGAGVQFDGLRARDVYALGKYFETLATP
jgi:hypothetical protein